MQSSRVSHIGDILLLSTDGQTQHGSGEGIGGGVFSGGGLGGVFFKIFKTLKNRCNDV